MGKRFNIKAEWSKTIAKLFKAVNYHYPSLGVELKANFSITLDKYQHDAIPALDNFISQLDHYSSEMSATLDPATINKWRSTMANPECISCTFICSESVV